ncbi:MAG: hypothetical protein AAGD07_01315 [Planctomycetota bacterium]
MKRIVTHWALLAAAAIFATGCVPVRHNLPPEQRMMQPGPGVGGPGPGVVPPPAFAPAGMMGAISGGAAMSEGGLMESGAASPGGAFPAATASMVASGETSKGDIQQVGFRELLSGGAGCNDCGNGGGIPAGGGVAMMGPIMPPMSTAQVTFASPDGMQVRYDVGGAGQFDSEPLVVPARQNFPQGALYRLKLTNIPTRPGVELYPTVELAYANPRTGAYLAHNAVPIQFLEEDFDQVLTGNFVTKVIYLPDPDFQGPAIAGIDTLVSTRLDPSIDPIVEADRRGSILAIIRLGDKDIEMAGATGGYAGAPMMGPAYAGMPAAIAPAMTEGCGSPAGPNAGKVATLPSLPGMVSGMTAPQYGMPYTGTPIGLPGPPHIPLGAPAGLKRHVIKNHTPMHLPRPVDELRIDVRQQPGMSYPNPVSRIQITEQNIHPGIPNGRPHFENQSKRVY